MRFQKARQVIYICAQSALRAEKRSVGARNISAVIDCVRFSSTKIVRSYNKLIIDFGLFIQHSNGIHIIQIADMKTRLIHLKRFEQMPLAIFVKTFIRKPFHDSC